MVARPPGHGFTRRAPHQPPEDGRLTGRPWGVNRSGASGPCRSTCRGRAARTTRAVSRAVRSGEVFGSAVHAMREREAAPAPRKEQASPPGLQARGDTRRRPSRRWLPRRLLRGGGSRKNRHRCSGRRHRDEAAVHAVLLFAPETDARGRGIRLPHAGDNTRVVVVGRSTDPASLLAGRRSWAPRSRTPRGASRGRRRTAGVTNRRSTRARCPPRTCRTPRRRVATGSPGTRPRPRPTSACR